MGFVKHIALYFFLKKEDDHSDFSKVVSILFLIFVIRHYNKFVKYEIRNLINESDIKTILNDTQITRVSNKVGKGYIFVLYIHQYGKTKSRLRVKGYVIQQKWKVIYER